jgi:hypothetical protein
MSRKNTIADFWAKVDKNGPAPSFDPSMGCCWVWTGLRYRNKGSGADYGRFYYNGGYHSVHRFSFFICFAYLPIEVDHICHNTLCINPSHLRPASHQENCSNRTKPKNNTSGIKGVTWNKKNKNWVATIGKDYKVMHIGSFATKEEAHAAYMMASKQLFGGFSFEG